MTDEVLCSLTLASILRTTALRRCLILMSLTLVPLMCS